MSNVIDELKVVFTADTGALIAGLNEMSQRLTQVVGVSGAAQASIQALGLAFSGGLSGMTEGAYAAGVSAGAAFARGIRSQAGGVRSAAGYISAAALSAMGAQMTSGTAQTAERVQGAALTGFDKATMAGTVSGAGGASAGKMEVVVPLNVDGVKLGEACIRALGRVSAITGRAHIAI